MKNINLSFGLKPSSKFKSLVKAVFAMLLAIAAFSLVVSQTPQQLYSQPASTELTNKYNLAVIDAKVAEPNEVSKALVAISESNNFLVWQNKTAPKGKVLVATWTNWAGYDTLVGNSTTTSRETWVTAAPELQKFCKQNMQKITNQSDRTLRLEQLLGLPPNNGKTKFVEFWVNPQDLFRPSADSEITDGIAFGEFNQLPPSLAAAVKPEYVKWFEDLRAKSYNATGGYPWTRMGYTYDWGNPKSEVGLSEFVIKPGANIDVKSVQPNDKYCVS